MAAKDDDQRLQCGKRLSFSPSGHTPESKTSKVRKSGRQTRLLQADLQHEISRVFEFCQGARMCIVEVMKHLEGTYSSRSVIHAVKQCFPRATYECNRSSILGLKLREVEANLPPTALEDISKTQTCDCSCDCVTNTITILEKEISSLKHRTSILRTDSLQHFTVDRVEAEFKERAPTLLRLLTESIKKSTYKFSERKRVGILTVICKLLHITNCQLNALGKINGLRLQRAGVTKRMLMELNKTYDSVSYNTINRLLDSYGEKGLENVAAWANIDIQHCGDNVDVCLKARHELQGRSSVDLHMYNNLLYKPRIDVINLPDIPPQVPALEQIDLSQFIPNKHEQDQLMQKLQIEICKSWSMVDRLQEYVADIQQPKHSFASEMKAKSEKAHIGVLMKNECKTADVIDILQYCQNYPSPDQRKRVVYHGDYATYERVKQALSAMSNVDDSLKFIPTFADFHLQMRWSKAIMERFYDPSSCRDQMSLAALRTILNSKQVNKDTSKNYYSISLFLDKVLDAHLMAYAEKIITESDLSTEQVKNKAAELLHCVYRPPATVPNDGCPVCGKAYKNHAALSTHVLSNHPGFSLDGHQTSQANDVVHEHGNELMKMLLLKRLMDTSISFGDGQTLALVIKHMLVYFKCDSLRSPKYAIACLEFIAQQQIFLSEKMATLVRQERFVNNMGRTHTNIPIDLDVEHSNKFFKENFRLSLGEPSQKVLSRLSQAQDTVTQVLDSFVKSFHLEHFDSKRTVDKKKYQDDVIKAKNQLASCKVCDIIPGRKLHNNTVQQASKDIIAAINMYKLKDWLRERLLKMMDEPFYKY